MNEVILVASLASFLGLVLAMSDAPYPSCEPRTFWGGVCHTVAHIAGMNVAVFGALFVLYLCIA